MVSGDVEEGIGSVAEIYGDGRTKEDIQEVVMRMVNG